MKNLRCCLRIPLLVLLMIGIYCAVLVTRKRLCGFPRIWRATRKMLFAFWSRAAARIVGMHIEVKNGPLHSPCFIVGNHLSYLDIVLLATQLDAVFVAKQEMANWPVFGTLARFVDTIFVDRTHRLGTQRVNRQIQTALEAGQSVILFPEGWVSRGESVMPFHSSLLEPAIQLQMPIHYFTLRYEASADCPPAAEAICWDSETSLYPHLYELMKLPGFHARLTFGPEPLVANNRKELAQKLHDAVSAQFIPMGQPERQAILFPDHSIEDSPYSS